MKVTNELGLPKAFEMSVQTGGHNREGRYSATTILKGEKEVILSKRHDDEITVDVADQLWAVWGTAVHSIFEKQKDNTFKEESFEVKVSNSVVTGRCDAYDLEKEMLIDWKTASVWKVKMGDFKDWKRQGLIYAWLLKQSGLTVKKCQFIALLKDFSKTKAKTESDYPKKPVYVYEFYVSDNDIEEIGKFIETKVKSLEEKELMADDDIPACSKEERWADDDKYAIMKSGRKSAVRVLDSEKEAEEYLEKNQLSESAGYSIVHREPVSRKCSEYCNCCEFCNFYRNNVVGKDE